MVAEYYSGGNVMNYVISWLATSQLFKTFETRINDVVNQTTNYSDKIQLNYTVGIETRHDDRIYELIKTDPKLLIERYNQIYYKKWITIVNYKTTKTTIRGGDIEILPTIITCGIFVGKISCIGLVLLQAMSIVEYSSNLMAPIPGIHVLLGSGISIVYYPMFCLLHGINEIVDNTFIHFFPDYGMKSNIEFDFEILQYK